MTVYGSGKHFQNDVGRLKYHGDTMINMNYFTIKTMYNFSTHYSTEKWIREWSFFVSVPSVVQYLCQRLHSCVS